MQVHDGFKQGLEVASAYYRQHREVGKRRVKARRARAIANRLPDGRRHSIRALVCHMRVKFQLELSQLKLSRKSGEAAHTLSSRRYRGKWYVQLFESYVQSIAESGINKKQGIDSRRKSMYV